MQGKPGMIRPTHVYIVASPRPRTGKTTVARALAEFYRIDGRPVAAFDLDSMDATLTQFLPEFTERADISETRGQMELFDRLISNDDKPKVIDVSAHAFEAFFNVMADIGFVGEARRQSVEPVVLFAVSSDQTSARSYADLTRRFPGVTLAPVYNDAIVRDPQIRRQFPAASAVALPLRVPILSSTLRTIVDTAGFSFAEFRRRPFVDMPEPIERELSSWLKRLHLQFREMELRLLMSKLTGTLSEQLRELMTDQPQATA